MAKKRIKNSASPIQRVSNSDIPKRNVQNTQKPGMVAAVPGFAFDVSFSALYYSVEHKEFTNFLKDEHHFIEKFKEIREFIEKMEKKDFVRDLISNSGMRHCHKIEKDKYEFTLDCIKNALSSSGQNNSDAIVDQLLGSECLYQIGFEGGSRYIGIYENEKKIFRLYLLDYHHKIYPDERHNKFSKKHLNYCVMQSGSQNK